MQLGAALELAQAATSVKGYQRLQDIRGADNLLSQNNTGWASVQAITMTPSTAPHPTPRLGSFNLRATISLSTILNDGKYTSGTPHLIGTEPVSGNSVAKLSGTFDDVVEGANSSTGIDTNYPQTYPSGTTGRGVL